MTMLAPATTRTRMWRRPGAVALVLLLAASSAPAPRLALAADGELAAEEPAGVEAEARDKGGLAALVRVNLPLTAGADAPLKQSITRARDRLVQAARDKADARRPTLVLEIGPSPSSDDGGSGSEFEPAYALARLLSSRELADVKTVAWLPRSIRGHGVLVALACEELVMASDAEVGDAAVDEPADEGGASDTVIAAYREIAASRQVMPAALAASMIDPSVEVVQVESEEGLRFLLRSEVDGFRREHEIIKESVLVPAGTAGRFTGREGRQFGFVKYLAGDKAGLSQALAVPQEALEADQTLLKDWHAITISINGEVTPRTASEFKTLLTNEIKRGANWVSVRIDSVGGDLPSCLDIAATLADLDPQEVRCVAYVPVEAKGGAAVIALACDKLVMHPDATIGIGPQQLPGRPDPPPQRDNRPLPPMRPGPGMGQGPPEAPRDEVVDRAAAIASIRDSLAPRTERSWSLLAAMLDPKIEIASYRNKATGKEQLMSADEVGALPDAVNWVRGAALGANNQPLAIRGAQAATVGLAFHTVDNFDQLKRLYGIEEVREVESNWALVLVERLASPALATFLLFLGFIGMYIELKTPGVGIGGVVASIAFLLFFWSKYLEGTAESLEILMFIAGLVLMMIEVFVVPGFGIFGLAGGLMVLFSLILASQTFVVPHSQAELDSLSGSIGIVVTAGLGMVALALITRRYLPKAPLFHRMVLEPPPPEERITLSHREALADYSHLVGRVGEVVTDLRPAGKAEIDNELIDVIALGEPLDRGTPIVVVSAHANRVVVKRAT